jgi:heavy metal sensor kinase
VFRWPATLRWRLTLWYTALLAVPLVVLAIGFYALFARTLANRTDRFIDDALTAFSRELAAERRATLSADRAIHSTVEEVRFRDLHIAVLDRAYRVVAMTPIPVAEGQREVTEQADFDRWIGHAIPHTARPQAVAVDVDGRSGRFRVIVLPVTLGGEAFELTGAYPTADIEAILARIRSVLAIVLPLLLLCAAVGGYFMATRSLAPVAAMAAQAADITATNLRERLPVSGGEELAGLAHVINELLARLDDSFSQQRRFMADASHELRTPTAILRTEADVTIAQAHRSESEYRASLVVIRDAAQRLTRIVEDLFALARVDADNVGVRRERLYLEELVDDSIRLARPLAEARGVQVCVVEAVEAPVDGDADLLGRLLLNLLDNAIKHSPDGGIVQVLMKRRNGSVDVGIIDHGRGIPERERDRIFERFVRLSDAVTGPTDSAPYTGAGLGLAIARRIAEAHGGSLVVAESRPGRTEFRLTLPAS